MIDVRDEKGRSLWISLTTLYNHVYANNRPPLLDSELERQSPDERCMKSFPTSFRDLEIGWRLDALDKEGVWYPSTVINVRFAGFCFSGNLHRNDFVSSVLLPRTILQKFPWGISK